MNKEIAAILIGSLMAAVTASGASYIGTMQDVAANKIGIENLEKSTKESNERNQVVHTKFFDTLQKMSEENNKTYVSIAEIATIIKLKLGDNNNAKPRDTD